jgi:hypothetical protein
MNLGTSQASSNAVEIAVSGNKCSSSAFISSSTVTCVTPAGFGKALDVQININSSPGTLYGLYNYDARIVSPPKGVEYVINVGDVVKVFLIAKGEDYSSQIALSSFTGSQVPYFAGFPHTLTKLSDNTKDPSGSFTWAPSVPGTWDACFQLLNADGISVDEVCTTIRAIQCQHQVVPGETMESISKKYEITWKTVFWLNPDTMSSMTDVQPGDVLNIGRMYTLAPGESLSTVVNRYGTTWYQLALVNPRKVTPGLQGDGGSSPDALTVQPATFKSSTAYVGLQYCIIAELEDI